MKSPPPESPLERRLRLRADVEEKGREYRQMLRAHVGGLEVGLSVVVGALLGFWVDHRWETKPWGTLVGLGFGMLAAGMTVWRLAKRGLQAGADDEEPEA
jgi:F0F1-type ATP synthase assembly protein I